MSVYKPPMKLPDQFDKPSVFLSGCIEMGEAPDWQASFAKELEGIVDVLDPRRDDWDSSWEQSIFDQKFREQVEWEIDAMNVADLIAVNFLAGYQAPITLMELGLFAHRGPDNMIGVHCPQGFWKKGNVDVVCNMFDIFQATSEDDLIAWIRYRTV